MGKRREHMEERGRKEKGRGKDRKGKRGEEREK